MRIPLHYDIKYRAMVLHQRNKSSMINGTLHGGGKFGLAQDATVASSASNKFSLAQRIERSLLGDTFLICWITLQVLNFPRSAIGKNPQNLQVQIKGKTLL